MSDEEYLESELFYHEELEFNENFTIIEMLSLQNLRYFTDTACKVFHNGFELVNE